MKLLILLLIPSLTFATPTAEEARVIRADKAYKKEKAEFNMAKAFLKGRPRFIESERNLREAININKPSFVVLAECTTVEQEAMKIYYRGLGYFLSEGYSDPSGICRLIFSF